MKRYIVFYGLLAVSLLMLFQISSMWVFRHRFATEWILVLVATISIAIGFFYAKQLKVNPDDTGSNHLRPYSELGISEREYDILQMIALGLTNKEIGEKLFISENTVKTHVSNLLVKLDAKRRTQALKNAKELNII